MTCPVASRKVLSAVEKFREASITTDALAQLVASIGHNEYYEKLNELQLVLNILNSGGDVNINEIQLEEHHNSDATDSVIDDAELMTVHR